MTTPSKFSAPDTDRMEASWEHRSANVAGYGEFSGTVAELTVKSGMARL
jgi:hypothetical protein